MSRERSSRLYFCILICLLPSQYYDPPSSLQEQLQIRAMMAEGVTPQELAHNGLTSAIQPSVLKKD